MPHPCFEAAAVSLAAMTGRPGGACTHSADSAAMANQQSCAVAAYEEQRAFGQAEQAEANQE